MEFNALTIASFLYCSSLTLLPGLIPSVHSLIAATPAVSVLNSVLLSISQVSEASGAVFEVDPAGPSLSSVIRL